MTPGATVILESTTYPGTTEELALPLLEEGSRLIGGKDFHLGYSPERIDPGNTRFRLENTPKVVSGMNSTSLDKVDEFFGRLVERTVRVSGTREAELTKLLENTFRHVNIALVNELAMFAKGLGIDVWEAIDAASTKPFGYMRFTPGPGVGGHCLPIDPSYLSWQIERSLGQTFRFVELANDVNSHMPDYVVRRAQATLNEATRSVKGSSIVVMGLAYKGNTGDARETPSVPICELLVGLGAVVSVVDPHVDDRQFPAGTRRIHGEAAELAAADLVLFVVDHDAFDTETITKNATRILDCRHVLSGPNVEHL
ncbi:MAG: nucleotide sugar dehydrogenase [Microthrixaceae bacterium]